MSRKVIGGNEGFRSEIQISDAPLEYVIVEDDGEVAYAYHYLEGKIASYVWLYNRLPAPPTVVKREGTKPPLNPRDYVADIDFELPASSDDFEARGRVEADSRESAVYVRGRIHALMRAGEIPGWCILASKDGPVALQLDLTQ